MEALDKTGIQIFDKIRGQFSNVTLGDENAESTQDPSAARFFNFDFVANGQNFGNVTISIIDEDTLKIYFSKNITSELKGDQRKLWYAFLKNMRKLAMTNMLRFDTHDISRANLNINDVKGASTAATTFDSHEVRLGEGKVSKMYGTTKSSYQNFGPARIIVRHSSKVDEEKRGSRSRRINALFIENDQGERFKLPFKKISGARAMANHIGAGGQVYDDIGKSISEMVDEMSKLKPFLRKNRTTTFEDPTAMDMIEAASDHYKTMGKTLAGLKGRRGYQRYVENFEPIAECGEFDHNEYTSRFTTQDVDDRLESALPSIHKAYTMKHKAKESAFEGIQAFVQNENALQFTSESATPDLLKAMKFEDTDELIARVMEDIAVREVRPEIVEFATIWATKIKVLAETDEDILGRQLAAGLTSKYLHGLKEGVKEKVEEIADTLAEDEFETWANEVTEGNAANVPAIFSTDELERTKELLSNPLPFGIDGINADMAISDVYYDEDLSAELNTMSQELGQDEDAAPFIKQWIADNDPELFTELGFEDEYSEVDGTEVYAGSDFEDDEMDESLDIAALAGLGKNAAKRGVITPGEFGAFGRKPKGNDAKKGKFKRGPFGAKLALGEEGDENMPEPGQFPDTADGAKAFLQSMAHVDLTQATAYPDTEFPGVWKIENIGTDYGSEEAIVYLPFLTDIGGKQGDVEMSDNELADEFTVESKAIYSDYKKAYESFNTPEAVIEHLEGRGMKCCINVAEQMATHLGLDNDVLAEDDETLDAIKKNAGL